jgi:MFS family permease
MCVDGLWRNPDFVRLWAAQTISQLGTGVTYLALPITAAATLSASPAQMGLLGAFEFAPFLLFGLVAGAWVDRLPRRPILVVADLGRALLLGLVPLGAYAGFLGMELLYAVGFLTGVLTVFFDVAYQSYFPSLVEREQLVEGNAKLEVSRSVAQVASPGIGGVLVQLITAPIALVVDAASFLVSALFLAAIARCEAAPPRRRDRRIRQEMGEGLRVVVGSPYLRAIALCTSVSNLFGNVGQAVYVIYVTRQLDVTPAELGLVLSIGSIGAVVGAISAARIVSRIGLGPTLVLCAAVFPLSWLFVLAAGGPSPLVLACLVAGQGLSFVGPIYNVNQVSLRQAIVPAQLQGRMNASMRFLVWGTIPIGSLVGGFLGESISLRGTMAVAALGSALSFLPLLFSPVRALRTQPTAAGP